MLMASRAMAGATRCSGGARCRRRKGEEKAEEDGAAREMREDREEGGEGIERWALPVDEVCGGGQGPRGREMDRGDRAELQLGLGGS